MVYLSADRQACSMWFILTIIVMIIVYAIKSHIKNYIYVGMTNNIERRIWEHNAGMQQSTKAYKPYSLIYTEICEDRTQARIREKYWKSGSWKEKLKQL